MKPKNFPAKKLRRQMIAHGDDVNSEACRQQLEHARGIRTKINREKT
jgi:hypothetical protein